jgi:hypothetical protein
MVSLIKYERSKSMNDTPELDEALDQASETLTSEEEQEVEPQETPQEETKPEEQLEEEETFAQKPELEGKSPEELEEIYHSWNKAYTQKRQAEKEELARMAERLQELEQQIPQEPEIPLNQMTPEQVQQFFSQKAEKIAQTARENSYIESQEKSFYELDGRLNDDSPEHDPNLFYAVVGQVSQLRDKYEQEKGTVFGFDFVGEAKRAIEAYDGHVKEQVQKYINNQNKTVKDKVNKFAKSNPKKAGAVKKAGGLDIDDAFSEALSEVGGSFEY